MANVPNEHVEQLRNDFFAQRIERIKIDYAEQLPVKISALRLKWDTIGYVYTRFLTRYDTSDITDISIKSRPTKLKIVKIMKELSDLDYAFLREQIKNQNSDPFIKEITMTKKSGNKNKINATIYFSQPLVVNNGNTIFLKEEVIHPSGYKSKVCNSYKRINGKWIKDETLEDRSFAIE